MAVILIAAFFKRVENGRNYFEIVCERETDSKGRRERERYSVWVKRLRGRVCVCEREREG